MASPNLHAIVPRETGGRQLPGRGILVVEDDDFVREAAAEILQSCGYRVVTARNSAEALGVFCRNKEQMELIVADVMIPGKNGRELVSTLRELSPSLKALYVSGYSENAIARKIDLDPNSRYMAKPFSLQRLLQTVEAIFESPESYPSQMKV